MKSNALRVLLPVMAVLVGSSCASTKMVKNWVYPESGPIDFDKVMALVLVQDKFVRQAGEDEMVRQVRQAEAIPAYTVLPDRELENESRIREVVAASGVDGIIVMRPVYDQKEVSYVPGSYPAPYYSFYGYYSWAYPVVYSPGYYREDRLVGVETTIYDAHTGKLVWSGLSQTENPKDASKLVAATAKAVRKVMKKYGFLT
jgi:hypothetical protein